MCSTMTLTPTQYTYVHYSYAHMRMHCKVASNIHKYMYNYTCGSQGLNIGSFLFGGFFFLHCQTPPNVPAIRGGRDHNNYTQVLWEGTKHKVQRKDGTWSRLGMWRRPPLALLQLPVQVFDVVAVLPPRGLGLLTLLLQRHGELLHWREEGGVTR